MSQASETIVVGKVGAPYGVKGWVRIISYTEDTQDIFSYQPWNIGDKQNIKVEHWRKHQKGLIAKLVGFDDRDQVDSLKNLDVIIRAEQLPMLADDEFYWRDVIGMRVVTDKGYDLGTLTEIFATGANDVLRVKANAKDAFGQKERLIPMHFEQVIKALDEENKQLVVDWDPSF
jgi:16S rRNA processing protein RimM